MEPGGSRLGLWIIATSISRARVIVLAGDTVAADSASDSGQLGVRVDCAQAPCILTHVGARIDGPLPAAELMGYVRLGARQGWTSVLR